MKVRHLMDIVALNAQNRKDINKANQPFTVIGKLKPSLCDGKWSCTEELFPVPCTKSYADEEECFYDSCIGSKDRRAYLAYEEGQCVGQVVLHKDWNGYALIEDICVARDYRGQGIGSALIERAVEWARGKGLQGLALETQDNNLLACRFYMKLGFCIGGVNTLFYRNFRQPYRDEIAIYWYLLF